MLRLDGLADLAPLSLSYQIAVTTEASARFPGLPAQGGSLDLRFESRRFDIRGRRRRRFGLGRAAPLKSQQTPQSSSSLEAELGP